MRKSHTITHRRRQVDPSIRFRYDTVVPESASKAIGYIRVSTEEQKRDGISLDAQKERIIAYCAFFKYDLIAIYQDDSTGFDMNRPGLHAAFEHMKRTGSMFVAIALDRLSRNIIDVEYIVDSYFGLGCDYQIHLMDCAGIDPKTRDGRMMLRFKALMAQHQVETIRDRTQQGVRYAMKHGASVGRLPYGKAYSRQLDAEGRRVVVDVPEQLATIARIKELHAQNATTQQIAKILQSENRPTAAKGKWDGTGVRKLLQRHGLIQVKALDRAGYVRDPQKALVRIKELRSGGMSLREIGRSLSDEKIAPPRGKRWYAGTISDIISKNTVSDKIKAIRLAAKLRDSGMSLRKIGEQLMMNSITPPRGGYWHAEQVNKLLKEAQIADMADTIMDVLGPAPTASAIDERNEASSVQQELPAQEPQSGSVPPSPSVPAPPRGRSRKAA